MKIIVLGAGAIGSLYGAKLSSLNDITLIARKPHADMINKKGLKITGVENKTYKLKAMTKVRKIEANTLILLTTKVPDGEKAIEEIKDLIKKDTIILCLQNGLYSEKIIKKIVGKKCLVLRGITAVGASYLKPGTIMINNVGYTAIENSSRSKEIAENFDKCGLKGYVSGSIKADMWKKLILNCILNPATAILKIRNFEIADEKLRPLKRGIIKECIEVAKKDGVNFRFEFIENMIDSIKSNNLSSMYQDLIKGKKTEIDYLNGAVVRLGEKYGIKCPINESLVSMIRFLENKK